MFLFNLKFIKEGVTLFVVIVYDYGNKFYITVNPGVIHFSINFKEGPSLSLQFYRTMR